jgi:hypothetical protein
MNNLEIKKQIDANYNLIEQSYKPDCFVLNTKVAKLMEEINVLQNLCQHNFVDGKCEFCYKEGDCE